MPVLIIVSTTSELAAALARPVNVLGYRIELRGGVYSGDFTSTVMNAVICPYQHEQPIIDGSLTISGSDTTWRKIEIRYSGWLTRQSAFSGSNPADIPTSKNLSIFGQRTKMQQCVIHDLAGPGFWTPAVDGALEECLFYNNGWNAPDRGHGHGLYSQNATGTKTIKRCVFSPGYSDWNIHCYTEGGSIQGFDFQECVSIGGTVLIGGYTPVDRLTMTRNILFGGTLATGYNPPTQNLNATLIDTILANGASRVTRGLWSSLTEQGTDTTIGSRILVYGGIVIVFNQAQAASVIAPVTGTYRNCQNPAELITLNAGDPLPMDLWTVATPIAGVAPLATFDTRFAVFLVEPL